MASPADDALPPTALAATDLGPPTLGSVAPDDGPRAASSSPGPSAHRYVLGPLIGRGGMGEVRVAHDTRMEREVAVKVLRGDGRHRDDLRARFLREARVQGRLQHPAIVPVHDLGVDDAGHPFFVMKRLSGATLGQILAASPPDPAWPRRALLDRLVDVCQAIEYAHQRGVVHRDLKPANIMLGDLGEVYVLDWGIARLIGDDPAAPSGRAAEVANEDRTQTGALIGTPGYMAPEQLRGDVADQRADVYALGCVLFEVLTGAPALPFGAAALEATLTAAAHSPRARQPDGDVPPELDALCVAATTPELAARLPTAGALAAGLRRYLDGDRDLARRRELADGFAAAAVAEIVGDAGDAARARAMRDAGRALALDPTHPGAQALIGRLLLEPPRQVPRAVEDAVDAHRVATARVHIEIGRRAYLAHLVFFGFLLFATIHVAWPPIALGVAMVANLTLLYTAGSRPRPTQGMVHAMLVVHGALLVLAGLVVPSWLFLPAMTVTTMGAFLVNPIVVHPRITLLVHLVAMATPATLELLHVLPSSITVLGHQLVIASWVFDLSAPMLLVLVALLSVAQVLGTYTMIGKLRRAQEKAQHEIHLYKWHLEQLVPARAA